MNVFVTESDELIARIKRVAAPGLARLDAATRATLCRLTAELLRCSAESVAEFRRYLQTAARQIDLAPIPLADRLAGRTVLVTGASGCIGTALLGQLVRYRPARVVGIGITAPDRPVPGVSYHHVDITDREELVDHVAQVRPDLVFHLAAQRDPGLAERAVRRTVRTNVLGTRNVVDAAAAVGAQLVYASTGKALRPYTSDVYAASKRAGEWVVGDAAAQGRLPCSAARFTHVVDNAIVLERFHRWCRDGEPVRLHAVETRFYVQSALESAQLLLVAALAPHDDQLRVYAISDLGWPIGVLDIALGVVDRHGGSIPIYVAGHEPGYEQRPYPGLFDPAYSGDVSPLFNAMEAPGVRESPSPQVGVSVHRVRPDATVQRRIDLLERLCAGASDAEVRAAFNELAWSLLDAACCVTPQQQLRRIARITTPHREAMSAEHLRMDDQVRRWAGLAAAAAAAQPQPLAAG